MSGLQKRQAYRWLSSLSAYCRFWLALSVFLGVLNGVFIVVQAYLLASILYKATVLNATRSVLMQSMSYFLVAVGLRALVSWWREIVNLKSAVAVKKELRNRIIQQIKSLGPVRLIQYQGGGLSTVAVEQVEAVHDFFANYLPQMVLVAVLPILILLVVFPQSWLAGLILLLTAPLIPLFMAFVGMGAEARAQKQYEQMGKMSGYFLDVLRGLMTLKLFNQSARTIKKIASISDAYRRRTMSVLRIAFLSSAVLELFSSVAIAILAVYLGLSLLGIIQIGFAGKMISLQSALLILILAPEFFLPLRQLGVHYHARAQAIAAASELKKILDIEISECSRSIQYSSVVPPEIIFKQVDFSYESLRVLSEFNLVLQPNQHTVIVGESGAGKSTILNLICGFVAPSEGSIEVGGQNLNEIDLVSWRTQIAWLGQNTRLFYGTIRDNLCIAKPDATDAELLTALQVAYLDDLVRRLPKGLDTLIGDQNVGLSQGQIQRMALCRAYLKNAPLLLLDEATANLDAHSEKVILEAVNGMRHNKTIVSVTHRQQVRLSADKVVDLSKSMVAA